MTKSSIKDLIRNNLSIPTLPDVVLKINRLIEESDAGTAEIGALVSEDAPLAAKVLRIANSAFYGLSGDCVSTAHACTVLGIKVLKNIVTQVAVITQFEHLESSEHFDISNLWFHAGFTAQLCSNVAQHSTVLRAFTPEEMYVCGLLHDVGKVVMLDGLGESYLRLAEQSAVEDHPMFRIENAALGFNHTDVGAILASRWGLPEQIANAIQYHHGPRNEVSKNVIVSIVAHANLLAHRMKAGDMEAARAVFDQVTCEQLGISDENLEKILEFAEENRNVNVP